MFWGIEGCDLLELHIQFLPTLHFSVGMEPGTWYTLGKGSSTESYPRFLLFCIS